MPKLKPQTTPLVSLPPQLEAHIRNVILSNPFVPPTGNKCPINDLPNELLAQIFAMGALEDDCDDDDDRYQEDMDEGQLLDDISSDCESDGDDVDDGVEPPFQVLVSHVCKHWRTIGMCLFPLTSLDIVLNSQCSVGHSRALDLY